MYRIAKHPTKVKNGMCEHGCCDGCPHGCFDAQHDDMQTYAEFLRELKRRQRDVRNKKPWGKPLPLPADKDKS